MARAGGNLRVWGSLVLLGLCGCSVVRAAASNPVRNLRAETQTNTSITPRPEAPDGTDPQNVTHWVQWLGDGGTNNTHNTTGTSVRVDRLVPASSSKFSLWGEKDGVSSSPQMPLATTDRNAVRNLRVEGQTNTSISLSWEPPENSSVQNLTYWAQCSRYGVQNGTPQPTKDTSVTVNGLDPGSVYECSVRVEQNGVDSFWQNISAQTAPNPVRNLRVEGQTNTSISLSWEPPENSSLQNLTYWAQCSRYGVQNGISQPENDTSVTVNGLDPGSVYECSVWVEQNGVDSIWQNISAPTAPNPVRNLRVEGQTNTSISLSWEPPENSSVQNLTYWAQCSRYGVQNGTPQPTKDTSVTVNGLDPGSVYKCSVWVEQNGVNSTWQNISDPTAPNPVRNLRVEGQTNTSISLSWEPPENSSLQNLTYWAQCSRYGVQNGTPQPTKDTSVTVNGLDPGSVYECSVRVEQNGVDSIWQNISAPTAPNPVRNLRVEGQTNTSISLSWEPPENSSVQNLTYWAQCSRYGVQNGTPQPTKDTSVTVNGLDPGSVYKCSVWVEQNGVNSTWQNISDPTDPNPVRNLRVEGQTNTSISLSWEPPENSSLQNLTYWAQCSRYGVQNGISQPENDTSVTVNGLDPGSVYECSVRVKQNGVNSTWQNISAPTVPAAVNIASCISTSGGYGVVLTWSCPPGGYEIFEVKVDRKWSSQNESLCGKGVTVSHLEPAKSYRATVTTISNGLKVQSVPTTCHTESAAIVAGAIVGILLLFILVGLLIFFLKRRRKTRQPKEVPRDLVFSFPGNILAKDFADHVRKNEKDSNCGFAEEYQASSHYAVLAGSWCSSCLSAKNTGRGITDESMGNNLTQLALEGQDQSQKTASALENLAKNRYRNVLPYDWSRVPLQPLHEEPGSDYINASFMPGLQSPKEFIATQGPLPHTVSDFWRMVWEQQSHTLVMLTNCMESGRVKCEHYWPLDAQPCTHGQLKVILESEEVTENWTVRHLQLFHMKEQETLSVRQFHYVAWPDHGVPHSPDALLAFQKVLRQWLDQTMDGGPPIVHCSAGVGRTGTLIALDVLLRQLECEGLVGPFSFVKKMRESRPLMVQTEAQYVFLHQCILRSLQKPAAALVPEEATYENVASLVYENASAIRAHESEVSGSRC